MSFVQLSESQEQALFCSICFCVYRDPVVTKCCRKTYCSECIIKWVRKHNTCPNDRSQLKISDLLPAPRVVVNIINQLKVIELENLYKHKKDCAYNPESICDICGVKYGEKTFHICYDNLVEKIKLLEISNENLITNCESMEAKCLSLNEENLNLVHEIERLNELSGKEKQYFSDMKNKIIRVFEDTERTKDQTNNGKWSNEECNSQLNRLPSKLLVIRSKVGKFSEILVKLHSPPIFVRRKMRWRFAIDMTYDSDNKKCFGFYLQCCDKRVTQWSFRVNAEFRIITRKPECSNFCRKLTNVFTNKDFEWGFKSFLDWNIIVDERNGYIDNDAVILEVVFSIDD